MSKTKTIAIMMLAGALTAGCGSKKEEAKKEVNEAKVTAAEAGDKLREKAGGLMDRAGDLKDKAGEVKDKLNEVKSEAAMKLIDVAAVALRAKGEIDKIYKATTDYDIQLSAEGTDDAGMKDLEAKLAAMPHITVADVTIGYEQVTETTLNGKVYTRHFRATWFQQGQKVGVSFFTKEQLDVKAFGELLLKIVPIVQAQLGFAG
jgi:hypothetical protein